ncbi:hypothetical protein [Paraburkholderia sacchari]|uniref:hypothetical protein n=1 Tax=Paraburkholderia sacchari TaxID=159450 RepID=UPI0026C3ED11
MDPIDHTRCYGDRPLLADSTHSQRHPKATFDDFRFVENRRTGALGQNWSFADILAGHLNVGSTQPGDFRLSLIATPRDWGLKDGSAVRFESVDVFEFDVAGLIERMIIVYDTYPIRSTVGDKYS